jgi:predicted enzyme related to lactoylglutathione lyase
MAGFNGIAWFEIGTDNPAEAERFYGEVFGWTLGHDDGDLPGYQQWAAGDGPGLHAGGLLDTGGAVPGYAVFSVLVEDVADTCRRVEAAGGKTLRAPMGTPGGITFAYLLDPADNLFQVFTPPSA